MATSSFALSLNSIGDVTLEAVIAAVAFFAGLLGWLTNRYFSRRKQLVFRVQLNAPIIVTPTVNVEIRRQGVLLEDASVVLLRVENVGGIDIEPRDTFEPMSFEFPNRSVVGVEVTQASSDSLRDAIASRLEPDDFMGTDRVALPKVPINRGANFKLLVLLTGDGRKVKHSAVISGGGRDDGLAKDKRKLNNKYRPLVYLGIPILLVGTVLGIVLPQPDSAPDYCASGAIEITGSTAFESVVKEVRGAYQSACTTADPRPDVRVAAGGSRRGTKELDSLAQQDQARAATVIAMSDGKADPNLGSLNEKPYAIVVFSVVINEAAGVSSLTAQELRDIYAGKITNWKDIGGTDKQRGKDLPIKMVSRIGPDSGSRRAFEDKALGSGELGISSDDCVNRTGQAMPYHRCEVGSTEELLDKVNDIDGAIGYAELGAARQHLRLRVTALAEQFPDISAVKAGRYPFWAVEYAYTAGEPKPGTLTSSFLDFMEIDQTAEILHRNDVVSCAEAEQLCGS